MHKPAIFFDRDGTLIDDKGYLTQISQVEFYPETFVALELLKDKFDFFIITNQSGIGKGICTPEEVEAVNQFVVDELAMKGFIIRELYSCPHKTEDNCQCKKPSPWFIEQAIAKYNIDTQNSWIIGDHASDLDCGKNAGIRSVYVLTGHGEKHLPEIDPAYPVCKNILEAAKLILTEMHISNAHS